MNQVIVKSLNKPNWAGMHRYNKCHDTIVALVNRNGYRTGLNAKEQARLEKELGYAEGELGPHSTHWQGYGVTLTDKPLYLNLDNPQDQLDYALLKVSPRVANSVNEKDKWPKAEYIIFDQEEDAKRENMEIDLEAQAMHDFVELSANERRNYLKLLGKNVGSMSDAVVQNVLFKIAKNQPKEFNRITKLPNAKTRILIYDLLQAGIVRAKGGHYYFNDIALGHGEEDAASYLDLAENQELKISLKGKLGQKNKAEETE